MAPQPRPEGVERGVVASGFASAFAAAAGPPPPRRRLQPGDARESRRGVEQTRAPALPSGAASRPRRRRVSRQRAPSHRPRRRRAARGGRTRRRFAADRVRVARLRRHRLENLRERARGNRPGRGLEKRASRRERRLGGPPHLLRDARGDRLRRLRRRKRRRQRVERTREPRRPLRARVAREHHAEVRVHRGAAREFARRSAGALARRASRRSSPPRRAPPGLAASRATSAAEGRRGGLARAKGLAARPHAATGAVAIRELGSSSPPRSARSASATPASRRIMARNGEAAAFAAARSSPVAFERATRPRLSPSWRRSPRRRRGRGAGR